jgi:arylformamidase
MRIVDLTLELAVGTRSFPTHPAVEIRPFLTYEETASRYIPPCQGAATKILVISDHSGTHVDAPYHFIRTGATIEGVVLEKTVGRAVMLDLTDKPISQDATAEMLNACCRRQGTVIQTGDIVLLHMWPGAWGEEGFFTCESLAHEAAVWLVEQGAKAIGTDLGILDERTNMARPVHMELLGRGIPIFENLVQLDQVGHAPFLFIGMPLKIKGATGSPVRAVALLDLPV